MNKLILCEGKTDAILLSYYLEHTCDWIHGGAVKGIDLKINEANNESAYWYRKKDDNLLNLLICGVGGKDNFGHFFKNKIYPIMSDSYEVFSKIAVVTDRDDREISSIESSIISSMQPLIAKVKNGVWTPNKYNNSYDQEATVEFLMLIIPPDKEGALETVLLDAISENPYDKSIVDASKSFVDEIAPQATHYIDKARLKLKAYLGVTWAIQYPEKTFVLINNQIRLVKWENFKILDKCFSELKKI